MKQDRMREIFSIPNLMSYLRLLLIPVFCHLYLTAETDQDFLWASVVVLISSLTDMMDGWVARRFHMITDIGKVVDPVADKLTHGALAVCLAIRHPLMWALLALMLLKEGYMGLMGLKFLKKGQMMDGAMWCGKVCTAILFVGLLILFLFPRLPDAAVNTMIVVMMGAMVYALCSYVSVYNRMQRGDLQEGFKQL